VILVWTVLLLKRIGDATIQKPKALLLLLNFRVDALLYLLILGVAKMGGHRVSRPVTPILVKTPPL